MRLRERGDILIANLRSAGPATCKGMAARLEWDLATVRVVVNDLKADGLIIALPQGASAEIIYKARPSSARVMRMRWVSEAT